jgi:hypothetical protein
MLNMQTNPYIHGTVSEVLDVLKETNFELMEPIAMIEQYGVAPVTGELTGGGFDKVSSRCNPCFGRIFGKDCNSYDLKRVLKYTETDEEVNNKAQLERSVCNSTRYGCCNINIILILMVRCQELGINIHGIITDKFIRDARLTRNTFATLLFFGKWLVPVTKTDLIAESSSYSDDNPYRDLYDAIYTHFNLSDLCSKIAAIPDCPDFYTVYQDYKDDPERLPENIRTILTDIYTLPRTSVIKSGIGCTDKEVTLDIINPFTFSPIPYTCDYSALAPDYTSYRLSQNLSGYAINDLLEKYCQHQISLSFWTTFHDLLDKFFTDFLHRINLLEAMRNRTHIPKVTLNMPHFPLIMVCEDSTLMKSISCEYRAIRPLKLGSDIRYLATDTETNKAHLVKYCEDYNLACQVVLFDELTTIWK